jgi:formylglycine-generating enzyme required for sulfatase activity
MVHEGLKSNFAEFLGTCIRKFSQLTNDNEAETCNISFTESDKKRLDFRIGAAALLIFLFTIGCASNSSFSVSKTYKNSIGMEFVLIPAGTFNMGGFDKETAWKLEEHASNSVEISRSFYLQKTEVTQGQWKRVMGYNHSHFKECGDNCPVEMISWADAQKFIEKLNELDGTYKYRLPTEAEWEYACRAETTTAFPFQEEDSSRISRNDLYMLSKYAWVALNSNGETHQVGTRKPNPWGLYDMHGNVWEWVEDEWNISLEGDRSLEKARISELKVSDQVLKGGSWIDSYVNSHCGARIVVTPGIQNNVFGFRCIRTLN